MAKTRQALIRSLSRIKLNSVKVDWQESKFWQRSCIRRSKHSLKIRDKWRRFCERADCERIKDSSKTVNGVPVKVFFSDASVHDTYYVDGFLKDIEERDHVVADRVFFDFEFMVKLWKQGVSFTTRTKRNASFDFVDEFVDGDVLVERYGRWLMVLDLEA